jgi:hypothetical protein
MISFLRRALRLTAIAFLPAGLFSMTVPSRPVMAGNQFSTCVAELLRSGVPGEQAGTACSDALIPKELSSCVSEIQQQTPISGEEAVKACYRVRRPVDLANCVVDINRTVLKSEVTAPKNKPETPADTTGANPADTSTLEPKTDTTLSPPLLALDSCRRSLLPGRHSECVIALSQDIQNMSPSEAMATCLAAEDFPRDLFPSYIPN